jgi:hypothetical protein
MIVEIFFKTYRDKVRCILVVGAYNYHLGRMIRCVCGIDHNNPLLCSTCDENARIVTRHHTAVRNDLISG